MPPLTGTFADAIRRAVDGDQEVAAALLREARVVAMRELARRTARQPPCHDVDDLSQEAFLRGLACARANAIPADAPAGGWMAAIARNVVREHRRRRRRPWVTLSESVTSDRRQGLIRRSVADAILRASPSEGALTARGAALLAWIQGDGSLRSVARVAKVPRTKLRRWLLRVASDAGSVPEPEALRPSPRAPTPDADEYRSETHRQVAALWREGRSRAEIAAAVGRSANAVKCLLRRLRRCAGEASDPFGPGS